VDHLFTGKVERVDTELLQTLLNQGIVPVVPPLGFDGDGKTYRVNSDSVAVAVAEALKATKLIYITAHDGLKFNGLIIRQMIVAELQKLLQQNAAGFAVETLSKAQHAVPACLGGVQRVHIINGRVDEGLLAEVFSNEGIGTLIYANEYQQIRPAKKKDVRAIQLLTKKAVESDELVRRTRLMIEKSLADYYIFEIDKNPVACVALHVYPEQSKGELACLYVNPVARKSRHRAQADSIHRKQGAGIEPERTAHALDAGVHVFSIEGRLRRRHARRSAPGASREIRPERTQLEGAGQEVHIGHTSSVHGFRSSFPVFI
jgi:amino-acid N-acetyltransferase